MGKEYNIQDLIEGHNRKEQHNNNYESQFPNHIIVPLHPDLYPMQQIVLGLIQANVRSTGMICDVLESRGREMVWRAVKGLKDLGYIKVVNQLYYDATWKKDDMISHSKNYWSSKRNPSGVLKRSRNLHHDKVAAKHNNVARKQKSWIKVGKLPKQENTIIANGGVVKPSQQKTEKIGWKNIITAK